MKTIGTFAIVLCLSWFVGVETQAVAQDVTATHKGCRYETASPLLVAELGDHPVLPEASASRSADPPVTPAASKGVYRLFAGDVVEIRFFFQPELNENVQIRPDGRISLQLIGEVQTAGRTIEEVSHMLEQAYATQLKDPCVSLKVLTFAAQKVYVTGEVVRPGVISMPGELTVLTAIGEAGGIKPTGKSNSVVLIRKGPDERPMSRKLSLRERGRPTSEAALVLQPYDIIIVPQTNITRLDRWVDQYVKQLDPGNIVLGFSYVLHTPPTGTNFIPF